MLVISKFKLRHKTFKQKIKIMHKLERAINGPTVGCKKEKGRRWSYSSAVETPTRQTDTGM